MVCCAGFRKTGLRQQPHPTGGKHAPNGMACSSHSSPPPWFGVLPDGSFALQLTTSTDGAHECIGFTCERRPPRSAACFSISVHNPSDLVPGMPWSSDRQSHGLNRKFRCIPCSNWLLSAPRTESAPATGRYLSAAAAVVGFVGRNPANPAAPGSNPAESLGRHWRRVPGLNYAPNAPAPW